MWKLSSSLPTPFVRLICELPTPDVSWPVAPALLGSLPPASSVPSRATNTSQFCRLSRHRIYCIAYSSSRFFNKAFNGRAKGMSIYRLPDWPTLQLMIRWRNTDQRAYGALTWCGGGRSTGRARCAAVHAVMPNLGPQRLQRLPGQGFPRPCHLRRHNRVIIDNIIE